MLTTQHFCAIIIMSVVSPRIFPKATRGDKKQGGQRIEKSNFSRIKR